ncbi:hypothetical protein RJ641_013477 [Dillenia turbinata]|uniref:Rubrerythrin diiron-binding domain-containing protein n=1 Tax=Dillenia turbinata TaxID=194707 RepID=A0AAN8ZT49_9MAGN
METIFNTEINKNLNQSEIEALLQEFKTDYNQTQFVRNKEFKEAADKIQGPPRKIFVEFLLYKEHGRRLKKTNPVVSDIFSHMSWDKARHAVFLNKGLSYFNLALDLGHECGLNLKNIGISEVNHIFREANSCADRLAKLGQEASAGLHEAESPPKELFLLLEKDVSGISRVRTKKLSNTSKK